MVSELPLSITPAAIAEVMEIITKKKIPEGYALRVGIKGGGCGAMGFILGFDHQKERDAVFPHQGIEVIVDKRHLMYVVGMTVDFVERVDGRGFLFEKR